MTVLYKGFLKVEYWVKGLGAEGKHRYLMI